MLGQIQEVYKELGQIIDRPQAFGLGSKVPQPLADRLESMRRMLQEAMREKEEPARNGDLEMELAQDADRNSS
ncbi:MAG TPA: hypothetical protein VGR96_08570 [Acidobacteriaceae bacterium]|nr:hypothetical protein [Acidobacteriaceae bacterium]